MKLLPVRVTECGLLIAVAWLWLSGTVGWAGDLRVEAIAGRPFGIAEISFPIDDDFRLAWQTRSIQVNEASQRLLFPIMEHPGLLSRLASRIDGEPPLTPSRASLLCFFTGEQPLEISVSCVPDVVVRVDPVPSRPAKHARLARRWWKQIWGPLSDRMDDSNRPRPVENYFAGMGLWRLGIDRSPSRREMSVGTLNELLVGTARLRSEASRVVSFNRCCDQPATEPLPPEIQWRRATVSNAETKQVEEMAYQVPPNCFYVRFGKYSNLLWAMRLLESQGEELQRLATTRGYRGKIGSKIQTQLAIDEMPFADLIGDQVIADVALIGRDAFFVDGAALGVIMRAGNQVLGKGIENIRNDAVKSLRKAGAAAETVNIRGQDVSLISTPDHRLRSFHVVKDEWHFVTNSRTMAEEFLAVSDGAASLGQLPSFQRNRGEIPHDNGDTIFAYLSTEFMEQVASPASLIELQRRLRARAEAQMLRIAMLAHEVEAQARAGAGEPIAELDLDQDVVAQLKSQHLLPSRFACRCDGSFPRFENGQVVDSLRGGIGTFLPVADVPIDRATLDEVRTYREFARKHSGTWSALDPLALSIKKSPVAGKDGRDRLAFEALIAPLQASNASFLLGILGQPAGQRIAAPENTLLSMEAVLNGRLIAYSEDASVQLSVLDTEPVPPASTTRLLDLLAVVRQMDLRILAEPADAAFQRNLWQSAGTEKEPYWYGPFDLVGRQWEDHAAFAFDLSTLRELPPELEHEVLDEPAQVWLYCGELEGSSMDQFITSFAANRAMKGSIKNVQQYHQWSSLLRVPLAEMPDLVESMVGLEPVCPLAGEYELDSDRSEGSQWVSTAWGGDSISVDDLPDYHPAFLEWCRGLEASMTVDSGGLRVVGHVDVEFDMEEPAKPRMQFPFWKSKKSPAPRVQEEESP